MSATWPSPVSMHHAGAVAHASDSAPAERTAFAGRRLGLIVSRFPKLTETFVLAEVLAMKEAGIEVELFPLMRHRESVTQPDVEQLIDSAHYRPYSSLEVWMDNLHYLVTAPRRYLAALTRVVAASWRSPRYLAGALGFFPKAASFARLATRRGVEHVHAHFANHPAAVAMVIHRLSGIPFSFTARGSDIHVDTTMLPEKVEEAALVVTVSSHNKETIVRRCGNGTAGKVHVVYGGIDTRVFSPAPAQQDVGRFRILCVARFEEVKGHRTLIDACAVLRERGAAFTCDLIGDGELRPQLEQAVASHRLQRHVVLHGNLPQRDIVAALRSATVCVLATVHAANGKREGIPNVLKEAMACGIPVVSSWISGIPELVDDGVSGILVPPRDPEALADALTRLATAPDLCRSMGCAGRARIERDFDLRASMRERAALFFSATASSTECNVRGVKRTGPPSVAQRTASPAVTGGSR